MHCLTGSAYFVNFPLESSMYLILWFPLFQASDTVKIPREYHRFILGKNGHKLHQLEYETATKITIPRAEEKFDGIKIVGPKEGIERARHEIQIIADEQVKSYSYVLNVH